MPDFSDPEFLLAVAGLILLNTLTLGGLVAIFWPGERGYFARNGQLMGWVHCFFISVGFAALGVFGVPTLIATVVWWVIAVGVFGLTLRQAIKLSMAQSLIYLALLFGVVAAFT